MNCLIFNYSIIDLEKSAAKLKEYFNDIDVTKCDNFNSLFCLLAKMKFNCLFITFRQDYFRCMEFMAYIINHKSEFAESLISISISSLSDQMQTEVGNQHGFLMQQQDNQKSTAASVPAIFLKNGKSILKLPISAILYAEVYYKTVNVVTDDSRYEMKRHTLEDIKKKLPCDTFVQCHRSYLVNVERIDAIRHIDNQRYVCIRDKLIPIGSRFKQNIQVQ